MLELCLLLSNFVSPLTKPFSTYIFTAYSWKPISWKIIWKSFLLITYILNFWSSSLHCLQFYYVIFLVMTPYLSSVFQLWNGITRDFYNLSTASLSLVTIVLVIEPNIELASLVASAHCSEGFARWPDKMVPDKMVRTKWYGQNGTILYFLYILIQLNSIYID